MRLAFFLLLPLLLASCRKAEPLPVLGDVAPFALTAQTGERFDSGALKGRLWIADFIYTTCKGPCPRMSHLMSQVNRRTQDVSGVSLVTFTVDPEHDTPEVLAEYAKRYNADSARWHFLTGTREELHRISRDSFKVGNVDGSLNHSTRLVLVDREGRIRRYYGIEDGSPVDRILQDLQTLRKETPAS